MTIPGKQLTSLMDRVLRERWEAHPHEASGLGLHAFDGRLPEVSTAAFDARAAALTAALAEADALPVGDLTHNQRFDLELLRYGLAGELFELTQWRPWQRDPMALLWAIEPTNYMDRSYAPPPERIEAMTRLLAGVPAYVEAVRDLLTPPIGAPVLDQAIESYEGIADFYDGDVAAFVDEHAGPALARDAHDARQAAGAAVRAFAAHLRSLQATASSDFALGGDLYSGMLRTGELVDIPLAEIEAAGERELRRNQELVRQAASAIAPGAPLTDAVAAVTRDHPTADALLPTTREMLEELRSFTIDNDIVSVVSEVRAQVRETPAFMRWAFAAMNGPGPFEQVATESFYYVTPVEPSWSVKQAEEWLTNFNIPTLRIISAHEVYPGHYVHFLRHHQAPSDATRVFGAYSFWEGWAHYCEEMMLEEGYGDGDPRLIFAQAQEALVRVCRLLCSLRMHTQGQTLAEATRFFKENAYMEELPASKEAQRGTFDPGYLNYTLGKLLIMKLREDLRAEQGSAFSPRGFHDELLGHGAPPLPLLRRFMLANDEGRVL